MDLAAILTYHFQFRPRMATRRNTIAGNLGSGHEPQERQEKREISSNGQTEPGHPQAAPEAAFI